MSVSLTVDLKVVERAIAALGGGLKNGQTVLRAIGPLVVSQQKERFKTGIGPDGTPWKQSRRARFADLNIAFGVTKANSRKPRAGSAARPGELGDAPASGKTLVQSGRLRDTISWQLVGGTLLVGSNLRYAAVHQLGAVIRAKDAPFLKFKLPGGPWVSTKQVTIPARPFLGVSASDADEIRDEVVSLFGDLIDGRPGSAAA